MHGKWKQSFGAAQGMKGVPWALHHEDKITFAFKAGVDKVCLVTAPRISPKVAVGWIKSRLGRFAASGGRESPRDKVLRKVIAAHGSEFVNGLRQDLRKIPHGLMEWHSMFSIKSHSASMGRKETEKVIEDAQAVKVTVLSYGTVTGMGYGVEFNDGKERS